MMLELNNVRTFADFDRLVEGRAYLMNTGADDHFLLKTEKGYLVAFHTNYIDLARIPSTFGPYDTLCQTLEIALLHLLYYASAEQQHFTPMKTFRAFDALFDLHDYTLHVVTEQHRLRKVKTLPLYEVTWQDTITGQGGQERYATFELALIALLCNAGYEQGENDTLAVKAALPHLLQCLQEHIGT